MKNTTTPPAQQHHHSTAGRNSKPGCLAHNRQRRYGSATARISLGPLENFANDPAAATGAGCETLRHARLTTHGPSRRVAVRFLAEPATP